MSIRQLLKDNSLNLYAREFVMGPSTANAFIVANNETGFIQSKFNIDYIVNGCVTHFSGRLLYTDLGAATGNMRVVLPAELRPPPIGELYSCIVTLSSAVQPSVTGVIVTDGFNPIINIYHFVGGVEVPFVIEDLDPAGFVSISGFYFNNVCA